MHDYNSIHICFRFRLQFFQYESSHVILRTLISKQHRMKVELVLSQQTVTNIYFRFRSNASNLIYLVLRHALWFFETESSHINIRWRLWFRAFNRNCVYPKLNRNWPSCHFRIKSPEIEMLDCAMQLSIIYVVYVSVFVVETFINL